MRRRYYHTISGQHEKQLLFHLPLEKDYVDVINGFSPTNTANLQPFVFDSILNKYVHAGTGSTSIYHQDNALASTLTSHLTDGLRITFLFYWNGGGSIPTAVSLLGDFFLGNVILCARESLPRYGWGLYDGCTIGSQKDLPTQMWHEAEIIVNRTSIVSAIIKNYLTQETTIDISGSLTQTNNGAVTGIRLNQPGNHYSTRGLPGRISDFKIYAV